eukprot:6187960-Pleurochrysis_carterae.AAC.1
MRACVCVRACPCACVCQIEDDELGAIARRTELQKHLHSLRRRGARRDICAASAEHVQRSGEEARACARTTLITDARERPEATGARNPRSAECRLQTQTCSKLQNG